MENGKMMSRRWFIGGAGAVGARTFAFAERAKNFRAPEFPEGAKIKVSSVKAKNRGGKTREETIPSVEKESFKVIAPAAVADKNARRYELEFSAEAEDGAKKTKLVVAEGFNHALAHPTASKSSFCVFAKDELGRGKIRFSATPINCFGARGKPLVSDWMAV